jgi:hypothetical protein
MRIPLDSGARSGRTRPRVPVHPGADRSEATRSFPVGAKRRMDDQLFSVLSSVVFSLFSFIPFLSRIDGPRNANT